jgi:uncharacterized repeat protein (TIGR03803 family)
MMIRSDLWRHAVSICATAAMLAGCAVRDNTSVPLGAMPQVAPGLPYEVVYRFEGGSNGEFPQGNLLSVNGSLYGTAGGGANGIGMVYSVTTGGAMTVLHNFKGGADGQKPQAGLIDVNGTLYGTTYAGGRSSRGTAYSISTTGAEKVLHTFLGDADGEHPAAGLVDLDGTLYGTTVSGGSGECDAGGRRIGCGTIFSITTSGTEKVLYNFASESDGNYPQGALIAANGALYGTTSSGGLDAQGTVFRITTAGVKKILHNFGAGSDGRNPEAALIDVKGMLYGTTLYGGDVSKYKGTVFRMRPTGAAYKILHDFSGTPDGANPQAPLMYVKDTLYGTTENGGVASKDGGTVYGISPTGAENVVYSFTPGRDGNYPIAGLIEVNGTLYGTAFKGGAGGSYGYGTVFSLSQ